MTRNEYLSKLQSLLHSLDATQKMAIDSELSSEEVREILTRINSDLRSLVTLLWVKA